MQRIMLRSKIHRARITGTELDYEGSITIDRERLQTAASRPRRSGIERRASLLWSGATVMRTVLTGFAVRIDPKNKKQ